jgi:D-sedoheptulose 7-phosphate isomerase
MAIPNDLATTSGSGISPPSPVVSDSQINGIAKVFTEHVLELSRLAAISAESCANDVALASKIVAEALANGNKILACGNGGSAADAQHFVAEFIGRFLKERRPLPAVSLTCDPSIMTAIGNDYGFEEVFARQVEALGRPGDVLVAISTSGRSKNIIRAIELASRLGLKIVSLSGSTADKVLEASDVWCHVDSTITPHIQELHTAILHSICLGAEQLLDF